MWPSSSDIEPELLLDQVYEREMWKNIPETQNSTGENNQYNTSYILETISS